ncbi:MAG: ATP-dependent DNA helicase RecG, partial [Crocinitomicaceae bacterium]|nr:ATP-dependent DNA helicase RecG [Crocinitomicaceae bacterium]
MGLQRGDALKQELNIYTCGQLLYHFPFRYIDRSQIVSIADIRSDAAFVQLAGEIVSVHEAGEGRTKRVVAILRDATGEMELVWFKGIRWIKSYIKLNIPYIVYGKPA